MKKYIALIIMMLALAVGCRRTNYQQTGGGEVAATAASFLTDSDSFDLEMVTGLFRANKVADLPALEKEINDPNSGINNVDIDKDGKVDFVAAEEVQSPTGGKTVNFVAYPSSKGGQDATTIATVNVSPGANNGPVVVESGYSDSVAGHETNFYRYEVQQGPTFGDMLLLSYMMSPRPVFYSHPYSFYTPLYHPYPIIAPSVRTSYRSSYTSTTHISPIPKVSRPTSYVTPAYKAPSGYVSPVKAKSIGGNGMGNYKVNTSPAKPATGFGGSGGSKSFSPPPKSNGFGGGGGFSRPSRPSTPSFKSGRK